MTAKPPAFYAASANQQLGWDISGSAGDRGERNHACPDRRRAQRGHQGNRVNSAGIQRRKD
jgi:hypothetical protein